MAGAAGDQRATYMQRDFAMLDLEGTTQFLSFFIVAAARQKGRLYAVPKQVKHTYQHFGGGAQELDTRGNRPHTFLKNYNRKRLPGCRNCQLIPQSTTLSIMLSFI